MIRRPNANSAESQKHKIRNDVILAAVLLILAAASLLWWRLGRTEGAWVSVSVDGVQQAVYPLSEDREVEILTGDEDEHRNVLVIRENKAYVTEADCPDSICVKTRAASYAGETIVCLPHKLVIEIQAEKADAQLDMTA